MAEENGWPRTKGSRYGDEVVDSGHALGVTGAAQVLDRKHMVELSEAMHEVVEGELTQLAAVMASVCEDVGGRWQRHDLQRRPRDATSSDR